MAFQLSPGVLVTEKDLTNIVPAVATSTGAFAGGFQWGPVMDPVLVSSEQQLVSMFGKPVDANAAAFFTAASFLSYSNALYIARASVAAAKNAVSTGTAIAIENEDDYYANFAGGAAAVGPWAAKWPGDLGNSIKVSMSDSAGFAAWTYKDEFDSAPGTSTWASDAGASEDELHIIILDATGKITGKADTILEKFAYVSKASDAKKYDGSNNYYKDVINRNSKYVWWMDHTTTVVGTGEAWGQEAAVAAAAFDLMTAAETITLVNGVTDVDPSSGEIQGAFALFQNSEQFDVSLVMTGHLAAADSKWVVQNIGDTRKDCVVFVSPVDPSTGEMLVGSTIAQDTVDFRTDTAFNVDSSYAVLDSGFKYMYDRYNDVYRWVPLNGDIAGLCARTDYTNDAWWSPGGLNRGQIKNSIKLSFNPNKAERDLLYKNGVNPVVSFPGQGTVLYGDKTLQSKPSAFDRINVRRLFIVLEKAIATAAKYQLFEFNDSFTRAQFRAMVEPFLRDVQGRRGVVDFRVICDDTNNTGEVIDRNEFVADIYIKPTRSINFITLNFIAVRTGVSFNEIA